MTSVFIDGSAGTTGLRIRQRLEQRKDLQLLSLPEEMRKDESARRDYLNRADVAFLCLPDAAAIEAAGMVENSKTVLIDTSTAHRINDGWVYGFPELTGQRERIRNSKRIANPGCHASGFIALAAPLVEKGLLPKDAGLSCFSLTGFSGGGKKMIAEYDSGQEALTAPRMYGLKQNHKHLPEMKKHCGLESEPVFCPVVSSYYSGMQVVIPLFPGEFGISKEQIEAVYRDYYPGKIVRTTDGGDENGFLSASGRAGFDDMEISVFGNDRRLALVCRFDNLGKGASGAAIQNMNLVLGLPEETGLNLEDIA